MNHNSNANKFLNDSNLTTTPNASDEDRLVVQYSAVGRYHTYRCGVATDPRRFNEALPKTLATFSINSSPYWGWSFVPSSVPVGETIEIGEKVFEVTHNRLRVGDADRLSAYYFRAEQVEPEPDDA